MDVAIIIVDICFGIASTGIILGGSYRGYCKDALPTPLKAAVCRGQAGRCGVGYTGIGIFSALHCKPAKWHSCCPKP